MGTRYTMIDGNRDGSFTLYCYLNDTVVYERKFANSEAARETANLFLDKKLELEPA
jgi:hypothetical protein